MGIQIAVTVNLALCVIIALGVCILAHRYTHLSHMVETLEHKLAYANSGKLEHAGIADDVEELDKKYTTQATQVVYGDWRDSARADGYE